MQAPLFRGTCKRPLLGDLGCPEGGHGTEDALVLFPGVQARDGVEAAELQAAVPHNPDHGDPEAGVEGEKAARACGRAFNNILIRF